MSLSILKDEIKKGIYRKLYTFYGQEEYLKEYYLNCIENAILSENEKLLNRIVLEGKVDPGKIIDTCETLPVFSEKKLVIVKNSGIFKPKKKTENSKENIKAQDNELYEFIGNIPEYTCLIFYEENIDLRVKLVGTIKKNGLLVDFSYQKPEELAKWAVKVFRGSKKSIDLMIASQLIENCDQGMNEILNEINKVIMYVGERDKITQNDVEAVCSRSIKSRIFDLTDAIAAKNCELALNLLNDMIVLREPLPLILFMITRQFRHILQMKLLIAEGASSGEAAKKMGIPPFAASKVSRQAKSFSVEELKNIINKCLDIDVAIKNGKINDRLAAELLIAEISN